MKKIAFITGTRADYGKIKSIILKLQKNHNFKIMLFVTGMHNIKKYGSTYDQIKKDRIRNITRFFNQKDYDQPDVILANTIFGFKKFIKKTKPDLIVVHGDRIESLACSIVGCINNIKIAHIEGGEISGTLDEIFRHSISKISNIHFVTNKIAKKRLIQMGENPSSIFIIGSPDVDIILSKNLPSLDKVKLRYNIKFKNYALAILHPNTNRLDDLNQQTKIFLRSLQRSKKNFVLIYPNNDPGAQIILKLFSKLNLNNIKIFPSLRFEYYLTLLKYSDFIIGNSSSGIMEAPYYGTPTINLGDRQLNRAKLPTIKNVDFNENKIIKMINKYSSKKISFEKSMFFGDGNSGKKFIDILVGKKIWNISNVKQFKEISLKNSKKI